MPRVSHRGAARPGDGRFPGSRRRVAQRRSPARLTNAKEVVMRGHRRLWCGAALGLGALLLSGCASTQEPEVQRVATAFENSGGDPEARCDLLTPKALAALEQSESQACSAAIGQLSLNGGHVRSVQ